MEAKPKSIEMKIGNSQVKEALNSQVKAHLQSSSTVEASSKGSLGEDSKLADVLFRLPPESELKKLSRAELNQTIRRHAKLDQKSTACLVFYLAECERLRSYLDEGYTSLFQFLTQGLGYSDSEASYRFHAARLSLQVPEVNSALACGELTLTQVAKVQSTWVKEERSRGEKISVEMKKQVLCQIKGQSTRQTEKVLADALNLEPHHQARVVQRQLAQGKVEVTLTFTNEQMQDLERIKELFSHKCPGADLVDVISMMVAAIKKRKDLSQPKKAKRGNDQERTLNSSIEGAAEKAVIQNQSNSLTTDLCVNNERKTPKSIPISIKRQVFQRDQGQCQHRNSNGSKCGSRFQIQIDHRTPKYAGGTNELQNLQLLCAIHNQEKYRRESNTRRK